MNKQLIQKCDSAWSMSGKVNVYCKLPIEKRNVPRSEVSISSTPDHRSQQMEITQREYDFNVRGEGGFPSLCLSCLNMNVISMGVL